MSLLVSSDNSAVLIDVGLRVLLDGWFYAQHGTTCSPKQRQDRCATRFVGRTCATARLGGQEKRSLGKSVSRDMLADLQRHFAGSGTTRENSVVVRPVREPLSIQHGPLLRLELPEIGNLPYRLAANGCSTDSEGIGAYAALTGSGRAVVGYFTCPTVNAQIAALQAVRFGLRELDVDRAEVFVANARVADSLRRIAAGEPARYIDSFTDRNGIRDIARSAHRVDIQVRKVDGRSDHLLPAHTFLEIASRLSLSACRLAVHGIPFDMSSREFLHEVGCHSGHRRFNIQRRCDRFIARRDCPT